jgi:hypothetical protein
MWATHGGDVAFLVVYIREAHALDGRSPLRKGGLPLVEEPLTLKERNAVATVCLAKTALEGMPAVVDGIDNAVEKAYAAAPDRLYLIGRDGSVAYQGGRGPFGFLPLELEQAIRAELAGAPSP